MEFPPPDLAARQQEIGHQGVAVVGDVEHQVGAAGDPRRRERRGLRRERFGVRHQIEDTVAIVGEGQARSFGACRGRGRGRVIDVVAVDELDGISGQAEIGPVGLERGARHLLPKLGEAGRDRCGQGDAGMRREHACRPGRTGLGQEVPGVDGHLGAGALGGDRRGQPERAAADHRHPLGAGGHRLANRDLGRAPRQRPAAAAVAVVVHHQRGPDLLGVEPGPRSPERTKADRQVEQALGACAQRREPRTGAQGRGRQGRTAGGARQPEPRKAGSQHGSAMQRHVHLPSAAGGGVKHESALPAALRRVR